ncbi:hypothetical protein DRQ09_02970 [candidate division KSB1 bacterium]|nr:MAG: hypothetical protein DRQ09_02970 [candidate division KSB1 bacterium]
MKKISNLVFNFFFLLLTGIYSFSFPQNRMNDLLRRNKYRIDDWISYSDMKYITSIAVGRSYIYFGSTNGILRYSRFYNEWDYPFTKSNGLADDRILVVAFDWSTDFIWAAHSKGISYYRDGMNWWNNISKSEIGMNSQENLLSIGIDNNNIWIETDKRYYIGDKLGGNFHWTNPPVDKYKNKIIWFGKKALKKFDFPLFISEPEYLFFPEGYIRDKYFHNYNISYFTEDDRENLWLGTWGLGAAVGNLRTDFLNVLRFGLYQNSVEAIEDDDGIVWIGGLAKNELSHGITLWDRRKDKWEHIDIQKLAAFQNYSITSIKADSHFVWIGTLDGLMRYDKKKNSWKLYTVFNNLRDNLIYKLDMDEDGVWVATGSGVNLIKYPEYKVHNFQNKLLKNTRVYDIKCDGFIVWAATRRGIFKYDKFLQQWSSVKGSSEIVIPTTTAIGKWKNELWFATGGGIQFFNKKTKKWQAFPQFHYFENTRINSIIPSENYVWVGTETGLYKFNREKKYWIVYTSADGLIDDSVRTIVLEGNYLWLGTRKGLTFFLWNRRGRID